MGITRRRFLTWMGAAAGSQVAVVDRSRAAGNRQFPGHPESFGVLHDVTRCIGCRRCEAACQEVNQLPQPERPFDDLSVLEEQRRTAAGTYTVVNRFEGATGPVFVKVQCNHCLEPACASACFVKAFQKEKSGAVSYNADVCVGCRYCMIACPFNIPTYEYDNAFSPRVQKCTLCQPRIENGLLPGCVLSCPKEALTFGLRKQLLHIARNRITRNPARYVDHIYGEHEMGGTSWLYISGTAFKETGMREDLGTTAAGELTAGPLGAVPIVVGLWPVLLTGIWAIGKRKEQIADSERRRAVTEAEQKARQATEAQLVQLKQQMNKEKETAVKQAVQNALEQAASAAPAEAVPGSEENAAKEET